MARPSTGGAESRAELSRREALQVGFGTALVGGSGESPDVDAGLPAVATEPRLAWERDLPAQLDSRVALLGDAGVALAWTDLLASDEAGRLFALDAASGERLWTTADIDGDSTLRFHDGVLYHYDLERLAALEPRTGEPRWRLDGPFGTPAVFEGSYAAFSGGLYEARVVDLSDGSVVWRPSDDALVEPLSLADGRLVLAGDRRLAAFDVTSGDPTWQLSALPPDEFNPTVAAPGPLGFVTTIEPAATVAFDLRTGEEVWRRDATLYPWQFGTDRETGTVLAVAEGALVRLAPRTGERRWRRKLAEDLLFVALLDDDLAVAISENRVWAVSVADGTVAWERQLETRFPPVRRSGDEFYVAGEVIRALDRDGDVSWMRDLPGDGPLYPAVSEDRLVAAAGSSVYGFTLDGDTPTPTDTPTPSEPGERTRTATSSAGDPTTTTRPTTADGPGLGVVAALAGLSGVIAALLRRRRSSDDE